MIENDSYTSRNFIKKISVVALAVVGLSGCTYYSPIRYGEEHLTGEAYGVARYDLLSIKNSNNAELSLKNAKEAVARKSPIKAKLYIKQKGREYNINPHEVCMLLIDDAAYPISIISSFQDPIELTKYNTVYLPRGGTMRYGTVEEVTIRKVSFFLSRELFTKMTTAKKLIFNIAPPPKENSPALEQYPIVLELSPERITDLQEFKNQCVDNFLITKE